MNNQAGQRKYWDASALTQEINQATERVAENAENAGELEEFDEMERGMNNPMMTEMGEMAGQRLGNIALGAKGWSERGGAIGATAEVGSRSRELGAERELQRDEREMEQPVKFVGEETTRQTEEYLEQDQEDLRAMNGEDLHFVNQAMKKGDERVGKQAEEMVRELTGQAAFRPSELLGRFSRLSTEALRNEARTVGGRN